MAALIGLDATSSGFDPGLQDPPITFGVWGDSGDADGVIGSSNTGVGVFGRSIAAAAAAVRGSSQNGTGVQATSAGGSAVHARRDPGGGAAVTEAFLATPSLAADFRGDVATSGAVRVGGRLDAAEVIGSSDTGVGVFGRSVAAAASAVRGSSQNGTGVDATSASGTAVHARRDPGGGAAVTEAFLATPSLAADFRGDVATSGALSVGGRLGIGIGAQTGPAAKLHVNGAEEGIRVQGPATGNANVAYVSFVDSAGTRIGYVGDGSIHDASVTLASDLGDVVLNTAAGRILTASSNGNVGINGQLNVNGGLDVTNRSGYGVFARGNVGVSAEGPVGITAGSTTGGYAGLFNGDVRVTGRLQKGSSNFEIDHPLDPANKFLHHSGVECDEMKNLYDGIADLDADGRAEVVLPDWFEALNENFRYQLTPIGAAAPDLHIAAELHNGRFTIAGGQPNTKVCWQVSGVRHDAYAQAHPLQVETLKSAEEAGLFLHPEEHNQPAERSLATLFTAPANSSGQG